MPSRCETRRKGVSTILLGAGRERQRRYTLQKQGLGVANVFKGKGKGKKYDGKYRCYLKQMKTLFVSKVRDT